VRGVSGIDGKRLRSSWRDPNPLKSFFGDISQKAKGASFVDKEKGAR